jgi:N-acetylmuramoyl-L-alanine amidase
MEIIASPSPNFDVRKHKVDMLVLHYTGMESGQAALDHMRNPEAKVSSHYMVWEDGRIDHLVAESRRAWHAGVSRWQGDEDLNSRSIGIEIVNGGHDFPLPDGRLPAYPEAQIQALIALCQTILSNHEIPASRVVAHSDIAPARKQDPGEHFPWQRLAEAGIGLWPDEGGAPDQDLDGQHLSSGDTNASVRWMQESLLGIGYDIEVTGTFDPLTEAVVRAFQRRWLPDRVGGMADVATLRQIGLVATLYAA